MKTADRTEVFLDGKKVERSRPIRSGEGKNPTIKDILTVAKKIGLKESAARQIAENVEETVKRRLGGIMKKAERL